jgi:hypothetical protein
VVRIAKKIAAAFDVDEVKRGAVGEVLAVEIF